MIESLPQSIRNELHAAQSKAAAKKSRLRIMVNGESYRIERMTGSGFALNMDDAPKLRGLVDIYDGGRHVSQCLIIAATIVTTATTATTTTVTATMTTINVTV